MAFSPCERVRVRYIHKHDHGDARAGGLEGASPNPIATRAASTTYNPKYFASEQIAYMIWGSNCRCRASRARTLGLSWKPKHTVEDLLKSIKPEVKVLMSV